MSSRAVTTRPPFAPHPLMLLALCFAAGIVTARLPGLTLVPSLVFCAASSILALLCFVRQRSMCATLFLMLAFFSAGVMLAVAEKRSVNVNGLERLFEEGVIASGDPVEIEGVLASRARTRAGRFLSHAARRKDQVQRDGARWLQGSVRLAASVRDDVLRAEYEALELRYGARVRVMTALDRAERFRNPGVSTLTEYLEQRGLDATGTIKSPLLIERLDDERVLLPLDWLYEWRQRLLAIDRRRFSAETAGVLNAALLGNRYGLSRGAAERFREGGTFHVLVISGLHISFIGGIILLTTRRLVRRRVWQFVICVLFLWAYTLAVGAEPVGRARGVDVHARCARARRPAACEQPQCSGRRSSHPARVATERSVRPFVPVDVSLRADDRLNQLAAAAKIGGGRPVATDARDAVPATVHARRADY